MQRAGPVVIDVRSREVRVCDRRVELSATEYQLLLALAGEPHRVFTREELLRGVWRYSPESQSRTVDTHAFRLRRKLCEGCADRLVVNVWGIGYRLMDGVGGS
jgi:DNA-binding response OmpR family regulator